MELKMTDMKQWEKETKEFLVKVGQVNNTESAPKKDEE
jgi:hypothetical protein